MIFALIQGTFCGGWYKRRVTTIQPCRGTYRTTNGGSGAQGREIEIPTAEVLVGETRDPAGQ